MQLVLPELSAPAKLVLDAAEGFTEEEYLSFCEANSNLKFERTAKGEIVIVPPAGGESDYRSLEIGAELRAWAKKDGRGTAFGSSVEFLLPNGAAQCEVESAEHDGGEDWSRAHCDERE